MLIYLTAYFLMAFMAFLLCRISTKSYAIRFAAFFAVIWALIIGLRHPSMGIDLKFGDADGYLDCFQTITKFTLKEAFTQDIQLYDRGYIVYNYLLGFLGDNYQILLLITACIAFICAALLIAKNSAAPLLSAVIYCCSAAFIAPFSALRQCIAVSITFLAFEQIKKKHKLGFVLLVALAFSFHKSAIIYLIAYPIFWHARGRLWKLISVVIPIFTFCFADKLIFLLPQLMGYENYLKNVITGTYTSFILFFAAYLFTLKFSDKQDEISNGTRNLFFCAVTIQSFVGSMVMFSRMGWYFAVYWCLTIPKSIKIAAKTRSTYNLMYIAAFIFFMAYGLYHLYAMDWTMSRTYRFMLN